MKLAAVLERLGEWNPQFWRECKGRLKLVNVVSAIAISVLTQILVYIYFNNLLPSSSRHFRHILTNRYCTGSNLEENYSRLPNCIRDGYGNFVILKELWWLDIFRCLSYGLVIGLLALGTYLLILDLTKEESLGTLNFIRLSPQSARAIFLGKLLGVPILVYLAALAAIPLHLIAGLGADIPLTLILAFYGTVIASCAFFYQLALVIALSSTKISNFAAALISSGVAAYLWASSLMPVDERNPLHWFALFNPLLSFSYLVNASFIPEKTHGYYYISGQTAKFIWYNQPILQIAAIGITLIILHYSLWSYWLSQAIYRRFANPRSPFFSKIQSYWITGSFSLIGLGFILNFPEDYKYDPFARSLYQNFAIFQVLSFILIIFLTLAISPRRQQLLDWSRYHHRNWLKDLVIGEKSPSTLAITLNLLIIVAIITPAILLSPLKEYKLPTLFSFLAGMNMTLIYAAFIQWILLMSKRIKQGVMALGITGFLTLLPITVFAILGRISHYRDSQLWLFSVLPSLAGQYVTFSEFTLALCGQWLGIIVLSFTMTKQLRQAGMSSTKALS